jgi:hypothetical protein
VLPRPHVRASLRPHSCMASFISFEELVVVGDGLFASLVNGTHTLARCTTIASGATGRLPLGLLQLVAFQFVW